jgi:hypothetical protein
MCGIFGKFNRGFYGDLNNFCSIEWIINVTRNDDNDDDDARRRTHVGGGKENNNERN